MDSIKARLDNKLSMTSKELVFLAALLGETVVLGVNDPFLGWLAEQVEEEWKKASLQMFQKGWIQIEEGGMFGVLPDLAAYIRLCCLPEVWISMAITRSEETDSHLMINLNLEKKLYAQVKKNAVDEAIEFMYGQYEQEVHQMVHQSLGNTNNYSNHGFGMDIPEKVFKTFTESSVEESLSQLNELDIEQQTELQNFINDLKQEKTRKLIHMGSMSTTSSELMSIVLIEGEKSFWQLSFYENKNNPMVSIRQSDEQDCLALLESAIKQLG